MNTVGPAIKPSRKFELALENEGVVDRDRNVTMQQATFGPRNSFCKGSEFAESLVLPPYETLNFMSPFRPDVTAYLYIPQSQTVAPLQQGWKKTIRFISVTLGGSSFCGK